MDKNLVLYYDTLCKARVKQLRLRVVPIRLRQVLMSACHISPLSGYIHEQRTSFMILVRFWWPMVNEEVAKFI